ncbi:methylamine utilization protein [bacterium SCSIO 12696]|nr:methylamine utilization protein [bacterium SCSIO 12696]
MLRPSHWPFCLLVFFCCSYASANASIDIEIVDRKGKPLQLNKAVVYAVAQSPLTVDDSSPQQTAIVQRNLQFEPYISVIQRGTQVVFPNQDDTSHHVYSFSPAKSFELPLYKKQLPGPVVFDKTGIVVLGCNIHDWMLAYLIVVDTPFFTLLSPNNQKLDDLPPGTYQFHLWHPQLDKRDSKPIIVEVEGDKGVARFTLAHKLKKGFRPQSPDQPFDDNNY